jgi:D-sedoheptulose 7-phosphate isomerase
VSVSVDRHAARIGELLWERMRAGEAFFAAEEERLARLCSVLAERFAQGGRLLALGGSPQAWSDAHHVAVEFVHPVIVGKRALPALAVPRESLEPLVGPEDVVVSFEPLVVTAGDEWRFWPVSDDPFVAQELAETAYHLLWELVHVFLDHQRGSAAGAGASGFLYPFLVEGAGDLEAVVDDVRRTVRAKTREVADLRAQTLLDGSATLSAAARDLRERFDAGGSMLAFGNGGSATDAEDVVADFRAPPRGWPARSAIDLAGDPAILTALANDIGPEVLFARQVIAYGREGDAAPALSTSGGSADIVEALAEARRRGLLTIAFVGYDGGRIAAGGLADHVIVTRSEHVPRIQEAQASAYHVLRELVEYEPDGRQGQRAHTRSCEYADPGPVGRAPARRGVRTGPSGRPPDVSAARGRARSRSGRPRRSGGGRRGGRALSPRPCARARAASPRGQRSARAPAAPRRWQGAWTLDRPKTVSEPVRAAAR